MISVQIKNKETKSYPISATIGDILSSDDFLEDLNFKDRLAPHRLPLFFLTQSSSIILDPSPWLEDHQLSTLTPNPILTPFDPPSHSIPVVIIKRKKLQVGQTSFFCRPETSIEEVYSYFLPCLGVDYLLYDGVSRRPLAYWEKVSSFEKLMFLPPSDPVVFRTDAAGDMTLFQIESPRMVPVLDIAPWHLDETATVDTLLGLNDVVSISHPDYIPSVIAPPATPSVVNLKIYDHLQQRLASFSGVPSNMKLSSFAPIQSTHFILSNGKLVSFQSHLYELSTNSRSPTLKIFLFPPKFPVTSFQLSHVTIEDTPHSLVPFLHTKEHASHLPSLISQRFGLSSNIALSFSDSSHIYVTEQIF